MGEVIKANIGRRAQALFLVFVWLALILVLAAFGILVRDSFVAEPAIATTSVGFIVIALIFGHVIYRMRLPMVPATIVGVAAVFGAIFLGIQAPLVIDGQAWIVILFAYCFVASITPVWILLQPRDYLNSFILYALLIGAALGILVGQPSLEIPSYTGFEAAPGFLFPMLFVTVACGAISGFHSVVASGTTSKQLQNERHGRIIGYGGMLIEGVLALIALATAAYLTMDGYQELLEAGPPIVFAEGIGSFLGFIGIPATVGVVFGGLALNAFMLTTLDTATRLSRYAFSEFFEERVPALSNRYVATLVSVLAGGGLAWTGAWEDIWPLFGSSNQLLAGLALLAGTVWLMRRKSTGLPTMIPMVFMIAVTITALYFLIRDNLAVGNLVLGIPGIILVVLAVFLVIEAYNVLKGLQKESSSRVS